MKEEDSIIDAVNEDGDEVDYYRDFGLPVDEFEVLKDVRRVNPEGSESPVLSSRQESTVADTDEPRSSPAAGSGRGSVRGARASARRGRTSKLRDELEAETGQAKRKAADAGDDESLDQVSADDKGSEDEDTEMESEPEDEDKVGGGRRGAPQEARQIYTRRDQNVLERSDE